jgi:hypothetical protein
MNPVEVGDQKRLYYDVPIPTLPTFTPDPPTTRLTSEGDFETEKERLLNLRNNAFERRDLIMNDIKIVEDLLNDKAYASPIGFKPSIPTYDPIGRKLELEELAVETNSEGLDFESVKPLLSLRDAMNARDQTFKTRE